MEKTRIRIVEDEAIIGHELRNNLESLGYQVVFVVDSGEKAIAEAEISKPDIVLMDIRIAGEISESDD